MSIFAEAVGSPSSHGREDQADVDALGRQQLGVGDGHWSAEDVDGRAGGQTVEHLGAHGACIGVPSCAGGASGERHVHRIVGHGIAGESEGATENDKQSMLFQCVEHFLFSLGKDVGLTICRFMSTVGRA